MEKQNFRVEKGFLKILWRSGSFCLYSLERCELWDEGGKNQGRTSSNINKDILFNTDIFHANYVSCVIMKYILNWSRHTLNIALMRKLIFTFPWLVGLDNILDTNFWRVLIIYCLYFYCSCIRFYMFKVTLTNLKRWNCKFY